jgi:hypothetical protein
MKKVCTACGNVGEPNYIRRGSTGIEVVLWLFMILPGLIYSIWRSSGNNEACPSCGSPQVIPVDSPMAQKLMGDDYRKMKEEEARVQEETRVRDDRDRQAQEIAYKRHQAEQAAKSWIKRKGHLAAVLIPAIVAIALAIGIPWMNKQLKQQIEISDRAQAQQKEAAASAAKAEETAKVNAEAGVGRVVPKRHEHKKSADPNEPSRVQHDPAGGYQSESCPRVAISGYKCNGTWAVPLTPEELTQEKKSHCLKDYAVHPWYVVKEDGTQVIDADAACKETK